MYCGGQCACVSALISPAHCKLSKPLPCAPSFTYLQAVAQHERHATLQARHPAEHRLHVADAKGRHEAQGAHGKGNLRGGEVEAANAAWQGGAFVANCGTKAGWLSNRGLQPNIPVP